MYIFFQSVENVFNTSSIIIFVYGKTEWIKEEPLVQCGILGIKVYVFYYISIEIIILFLKGRSIGKRSMVCWTLLLHPCLSSLPSVHCLHWSYASFKSSDTTHDSARNIIIVFIFTKWLRIIYNMCGCESKFSVFDLFFFKKKHVNRVYIFFTRTWVIRIIRSSYDFKFPFENIRRFTFKD